VGGEAIKSDVERAMRMEPVTEGDPTFLLRFSVLRGPGVEFPGSSRGKFWTGVERRLLKDGMEVRFAVTDGTGTGVVFGDREVLILLELRMVVLPLTREALDVALGFETLAVDMDDPSVDERLVEREKRVEASDGAFWGFEDIVRRQEQEASRILDWVVRQERVFITRQFPFRNIRV
jgi:hypothetical protein